MPTWWKIGAREQRNERETLDKKEDETMCVTQRHENIFVSVVGGWAAYENMCVG